MVMDTKSFIRSGIKVTNVGSKQNFLKDWEWIQGKTQFFVLLKS